MKRLIFYFKMIYLSVIISIVVFFIIIFAAISKMSEIIYEFLIEKVYDELIERYKNLKKKENIRRYMKNHS